MSRAPSSDADTTRRTGGPHKLWSPVSATVVTLVAGLVAITNWQLPLCSNLRSTGDASAPGGNQRVA